MSGLSEDLDTLATVGGYESRDAVLEDALRTLLRKRPELRVELAIEKYRTERVSLNRAAELAGLSAEEFKAELSDRGISREAGFLDEDQRERKLDVIDE